MWIPQADRYPYGEQHVQTDVLYRGQHLQTHTDTLHWIIYCVYTKANSLLWKQHVHTPGKWTVFFSPLLCRLNWYCENGE